METEGIEGMAGIEIFGMAGIVGIDGALLNHPPTFDETPENTPPAFAALKYRTEKFHSKKKFIQEIRQKYQINTKASKIMNNIKRVQHL